MRIASEGYPFILTPALLALLALLTGWKWVGLILGLASLAFLGFFRDPERRSPEGEGLVLSPADGKIVGIWPSQGKGSGTKISIFLSPLDVHVNRAPIGGRVEEVQYQKGRFLAAYKDQASEANERNILRITDAKGRVLRMVQIAGVLARRIVCYARKGDFLQQGQRLGMIMFGSRVDLFLPEACQIKVADGQRVKGGETIMGRFA
jgi:phosphatidylserine decarboxylase